MYHLFTPVCKSLKLKVWKIKPDKLYIKSRGPHTTVYTLSEVPLRLSRQARANSPGKGMRNDFWNHADVFIFCRFNEAERQVRILFIQRGQETNEPDRDIYSDFFIAVVICPWLGTISQFKLQLHHFISVDTSIYMLNHFSFFQELIKSSKTTALFCFYRQMLCLLEESVLFVIEWSIFMDENKMLQ